jgi:hypothetical protein
MDIRGPRGFVVREVEPAATFLSRFRGLMGRSVRPVLLATSSVHGFWLQRSLTAVGLDRELRVLAVRRLRQRKIVWIRGARWILELPDGCPVPQPGDRLTFCGRDGEPGIDDRSPLPLRHSHRQPG